MILITPMLNYTSGEGGRWLFSCLYEITHPFQIITSIMHISLFFPTLPNLQQDTRIFHFYSFLLLHTRLLKKYQSLSSIISSSYKCSTDITKLAPPFQFVHHSFSLVSYFPRSWTNSKYFQFFSLLDTSFLFLL